MSRTYLSSAWIDAHRPSARKSPKGVPAIQLAGWPPFGTFTARSEIFTRYLRGRKGDTHERYFEWPPVHTVIVFKNSQTRMWRSRHQYGVLRRVEIPETIPGKDKWSVCCMLGPLPSIVIKTWSATRSTLRPRARRQAESMSIAWSSPGRFRSPDFLLESSAVLRSSTSRRSTRSGFAFAHITLRTNRKPHKTT